VEGDKKDQTDARRIQQVLARHGRKQTVAVAKRAGIGNLQDAVAVRRRRFIGHVLRLSTSRPVNMAMNWTPESESKRRDRPKRTWQDTLIEDLQNEIRSVASDRIRIPDGEDSLPNVQGGTIGTKSKSKSV